MQAIFSIVMVLGFYDHFPYLFLNFDIEIPPFKIKIFLSAGFLCIVGGESKISFISVLNL